MVGTRTQGDRMEGTDESNELWRHPNTTDTLTSAYNRYKIVSYSGVSLVECKCDSQQSIFRRRVAILRSHTTEPVANLIKPLRS